MVRQLSVRVAALVAGIPAVFFCTPVFAAPASVWDLFWNIIVPGLGTW